MVVLVADGVALLGLLLAPRPRMGGGRHRCSERAREGLAQFNGVPRGLCFISKPQAKKRREMYVLLVLRAGADSRRFPVFFLSPLE